MSRTRTSRTRTFAVGLALVFAAGVALAQDAGTDRAAGRGAELQKRFAAADKNGDGKLTRDEAQAGMPMVYKHFDEIDQAKAGSVSMADIAAFARDRRAARKGATP